MNKTGKIIVTIVIIFVFIIIFGALVGVRHDAGHKTPGIIGVILLVALIGGIKAIWKSNNNDNQNDNNLPQQNN